MLYAEYNKKMKKVAAFVNVLRRFKIPIIVVVALLLATVAALLGTRGIVYDSVKCPPQIVYGESVDYKAGAFSSAMSFTNTARTAAMFGRAKCPSARANTSFAPYPSARSAQ